MGMKCRPLYFRALRPFAWQELAPLLWLRMGRIRQLSHCTPSVDSGRSMTAAIGSVHSKRRTWMRPNQRLELTVLS